MDSAAQQTAALVQAGGAHIEPLLIAIEEQLRREAGGFGPPLEQFGGQTVAAGGKRLRPLLLLLCAGEPASSGQRDALVRAGAAVELIHSATLVHDDVLDRADLRRGEPTVFALGGREMAIPTGDLLFARAFVLATQGGDPRVVQILSEACSALAGGELLQRADAWDPSIGNDRYLLRCELKTARLFEAACAIGSVIVGQEELGLDRFGRSIGIAFQILDDVLDVSGPAERTGKPRGTDLLDGTVTLPLILARDRDAQLAGIDLRSVTAGDQTEELCDSIAATGALEDSRELALGLVAEAKSSLSRELDEQRRQALELVADSVVDRYS